MKTRKPILLTCFLIMLLLAACGTSGSDVEAPAATEAPAESGGEEAEAPAEEEVEAPAEAKVVTISFVQEPDTMNPMYSAMFFSGITREFWLMGLWSFDDNNQPVPRLAAEVPSDGNGGISNEGKTITIKLNPDAKWSDGTPLTSADFVFTYEMIISEQNTSQSTYPYADYVTSVEAPDDYTLVVNFNEPFAAWLTSIFTYVLPKHVLEPVFQADGNLDNADWNRNPTVGSGPFVFAEWESGSHLRFVKNENWFGSPAKIDEVFIRIVPDDAAQIAAIKAGDSDIGVFLSYSDIEDIESSGAATVVAVGSGYNEGWFLNVSPETAHPAMTDANVRRAVALATNREQITQDLLLGRTQPAATFWDTTPPYGNPDLQPYPYDLAEANRLLDEAGWVDSNGDGTRDKDGVELVLRYITNDRQLRKDVQAVVQQMWAEAGIGSELVNHSSDIYWNSYADGGPQALGEYDIAEYSSVGSFPDPEASSNWLCDQIPSSDNPEGANWQGYCNEEMDSLLTQQATTVDPQARIDLYYQIAQLMYDDVIWVGMWQDPDLWSISTRLSDVLFSGSTPFWNVSDWDITN